MAKTVKNREKVNKENVYHLYLLWKTTPPIWRGKPEDELRSQGFSDEVIELLQIPSKSDFAEKYNIGKNTCRSWEKRPQFQSDLMSMSTNEMLSVYKASIDHAFCQSCVDSPDPQRVRLFYELYAGHIPRVAVQSGTDGLDAIEHEMSGRQIMEMVITKMASRGSDPAAVHNKLNNGFYSKFNKASSVEDVDYEDITLPSDSAYDFNEIEKKHKARSNGSVEPEAKQNGSAEHKEKQDVKAMIQDALKKHTTKSSADKIKESLQKRNKKN